MMIEKALSVIPYAGLSAYEEENAPFFFGRERVRENIIANLKAKRLTLVFGASGVGKSSVLRAGVAYQLRRIAQENLDEKGKPEFAVAVFNNWAGDPLAGLINCVQEAVAEALDEPTSEPITPPGSLADTLRFWTERVGGDLLIILDQFEDYFLYHGNENGGGSFADQLVKMINRADLRVNFLISIRDDAFSKIKRFKESRFFDNLMEIEHLDREAASSAIKKPVDQYNRFYAAGKQRIAIEPELVDAVLGQLGELRAERLSLGEGGIGGGTKKTAATARIEAPFLQLVMTELWKQEMFSGSTTLRLATLNRLGDAEMSGAKRIVATHVTQVMGKLSENEQAMAARILSYLVTSTGDKFARSASDLADSTALDKQELVQLLEKLAHGDRRVLRAFAPPGAAGESRYEIFHDVLGPALVGWRRSYTQKLKERQAEEDKQRATEKARAEEKARAARRRRVLYRAIVVLSMLTLAGATYAWIQRKMAINQMRLAAHQMRLTAEQQEKRYILRASDLSNQTIARLNWRLINEIDPEKASEYSQFLLKQLNETLGFYQRDGNQAGEGITLNSIAGISRLAAEAHTGLGHYQEAQKYYQQANDAYQKARPLLENTLGPDHPEVATSINDLAVIDAAQGKYAEAEPLLKQSLAILEKVVDQPDDRYLVDPIMNLAECYNAQGKYDEAEALYNRASEIRKKRSPDNPPDLAESLNNLAWLYYEQGKYVQAESLFNKALAMQPTDSDPDSQFDPTVSLTGLGAVCRKRGKYDKAAAYFRQTMEQHKGLLHSDLPTVADDLENMGLLYMDRGKHEPAEALFKNALLLWTKSFGENHPTTAYGLSNLASLYYKLGRHAEAESSFNKALKIQQEMLPQSPELAQSLNGLARLYIDRGRYEEAEPLFLQALAIQEKAIPSHPDLAETLNNYAALLQKTNRQVEAAQMQQRAKQIQDTHQKENPDN
ncbi:MAG: hypothetical protein V7641_244 [Blastocatellia bacterium]